MSPKIEYAEKTIDAFRKAIQNGKTNQEAAQLAIDVHHNVSRLEDIDEGDNRIWHTLYSLIAYSDDRGFFRHEVFGRPQAGGPLVHKLSNGIRKICEESGYNFDELFDEACVETDEAGPTYPRI